jgi:hypothetical protein
VGIGGAGPTEFGNATGNTGAGIGANPIGSTTNTSTAGSGG